MTVQIYNKNRNLCKIINFSPRCLPKLPFGGRKSAKSPPKPTLFNQNTSQGFILPSPRHIIYNVYISNVRIEYPRNASESTQYIQESTQQNDDTFNISSNKWIILQSIGIIFNKCLSKSTKLQIYCCVHALKIFNTI